jgi:hypothetical protein
MYDGLEDVPGEIAMKDFSSLCYFCSDNMPGRGRRLEGRVRHRIDDGDKVERDPGWNGREDCKYRRSFLVVVC